MGVTGLASWNLGLSKPVRKLADAYRVRQINLYTFKKIAAIFAILTLQRRVIRRWNGNFVGFMGIFSKIVKNVPMKQYLHFSGKWQKWQISQFIRLLVNLR